MTVTGRYRVYLLNRDNGKAVLIGLVMCDDRYMKLPVRHQ